MNGILDFIKQKLNIGGKLNLPVQHKLVSLNITKYLRKPGKILIIPYNRMGTVILATRVFKSIRESYPEAQISVAVHNSWSVLIQKDPTIDSVFTYGDYIENPHSREFKTFAKELADQHFNIAFFLSFQNDICMAYMTNLTESDLRVSFSGNNDKEYFNVEIVPAAGTKNEVERYIEMFHTIGINGSVRDYTMTINEGIREKAVQRYLPAGFSTHTARLVGFDLTREIVGEPISRKNAEYIIKVIINDIKATVAVFFEPGKKALAASLKETFGKDIILIEDRPVSMVAGMMSLCRMIVTRNTDLFQLAIALKIPTMAVLTGEEMIRWSPGESPNLVHLEIFGGFLALHR